MIDNIHNILFIYLLIILILLILYLFFFSLIKYLFGDWSNNNSSKNHINNLERQLIYNNEQ